MEPKNIAIGVIITAILLVIVMSVRSYTTPTSIPTSTPTSIPTSTPTSIPTSIPTSVPTSTPTAMQPVPISATVLPMQYCPRGMYCDRSAVPQSESGVGAIVCGVGNQKYECVLEGNNADWRLMNKPCETDMKNACPPYWCQRGLYCDGTPVPQSEAGLGAVVCGFGNQQYKCENGGWVSMDKTCEPGMKNKCP